MDNSVAIKVFMGNKFNILISATILVTTVYYLWLKIKKRNSNTNKKKNENEQVETFDDCAILTCGNVCDASDVSDSIVCVQHTDNDNISNVNTMMEQSFTAELCNDFKEMRITSPQSKVNEGSIIGNYLTSFENANLSVEDDGKAEDKESIDELEEGEVPDDNELQRNVTFEENTMTEQDKVIVEEKEKMEFFLNEELLEELEDGEIRDDDIDETEIRCEKNFEVKIVELGETIVDETRTEKNTDISEAEESIQELEEGEIEDKDIDKKDIQDEVYTCYNTEIMNLKENIEGEEIVEKREKDDEIIESGEIAEGIEILDDNQVMKIRDLLQENEILAEIKMIELVSLEVNEIAEDDEIPKEREIVEKSAFMQETEIEDRHELPEEADIVEKNEITESETIENGEILEETNMKKDNEITEEREIIEKSEILEETDMEENNEIVEKNEITEEGEIIEKSAMTEESEIEEKNEIAEERETIEKSEILEEREMEENNEVSETAEKNEITEEREPIENSAINEETEMMEENEIVEDKLKVNNTEIEEEKHDEVNEDREILEEKIIIGRNHILEEKEVDEGVEVFDRSAITDEKEIVEEQEVCEDKVSDDVNGEESPATLSDTCDYAIDDDESLDNLMNYIDDCLNESSSDRATLTLKDNDRRSMSMENWQNDEASLDNIKRDFYELTETVCSPHPSSESDHAHCVNNLTERVATHSAESILLNNSVRIDTNVTPVLCSPINDDSCPELYVEKILFGDKELDVVYFDESVLQECGVISDVRIVRTIPVGISGRIIGKKGKTKNELLKKYGAELLIFNHPSEHCKQVLQITCNPSLQADLERWADRTLEQILKNTIQTTVSNPEWLKPMIPLGKIVPVQIIDMPTIQHVKLRIHDPVMIRAYNKMQSEINDDYSNADSNALLPSPVAVGCICIAMIRPDYFLRAEIISIYDQYAVVYLYDLGKTHQTCLFYLFKIREKYMKLPFQVIPARMPHAVIKNKKFTSAIVHKRFLCDQKTFKPQIVRAFFPRMNTCCEPCVHIYVSRADIDGSGTNIHSTDDCVDLLELLVSIDVCTMVRETVNCDLQAKINENHFRNFASEKDKKKDNTSTINTPVYFEPCNSKFYEDFLEFQYENSDSK